MEAILSEVLDSKIYTRENSRVTFQSPRAYLEPFLNAIGSTDIICKVQDPVSNENIDGSRNVAYPRVLVEARVGAEIEGYDSIIGIIFALNIQNPVIKIYTGQNAHACTNLTIFNAKAVSQYSLMSDYTDVYSKAAYYLKEKQNEIEHFNSIKNRLLETFYNEEQLKSELGRLLLLTTQRNSKLSYGMIAGASKLIQDPNSRYYTKKHELISMLTLYDAITQNITDSADLLYKPNKTIAVTQLLQIS